jgi:hypothetical protein
MQRLGHCSRLSRLAAAHAASEVREVIRVSGQLETVSRVLSGSASATTAALQPQQLHQAAVLQPNLPHVAPRVEPMTQAQLEQLVDALASAARVIAITGAGCSTEAGIPDYRGPAGAYTRHGFKPMTHQQFMAGPAQRARYFARSFFGWHEFANSRPAGAHEGLARLVNAGWVSHIITQVRAERQ